MFKSKKLIKVYNINKTYNTCIYIHVYAYNITHIG